MKIFKAAAIIALFGLSGCSALYSAGPVGNINVPEPVKSVVVDRYLGRWYEIARYDNGFEKDCEGVTADYSLNDDNTIKVVNTCHKFAPDGEASTGDGEAYIVDGSDNAKLRVSFFGPFYGDYWVLNHADDYSWSIVGEPSGRYLWILSRTATITATQRNAIGGSSIRHGL